MHCKGFSFGSLGLISLASLLPGRIVPTARFRNEKKTPPPAQQSLFANSTQFQTEREGLLPRRYVDSYRASTMLIARTGFSK